jgi:glycine cleavage system H protein
MSDATIEIPSDRKYSREHEWVLEKGKTIRVGISDYAQHELGDIVFVELPAVGRVVKAGEGIAVVESVKSVSDVYAPASGRVTARNDAIASNPALVNSAPYGDGWMFELEADSLGELLTADQYRAHIGA